MTLSECSKWSRMLPWSRCAWRPICSDISTGELPDVAAELPTEDEVYVSGIVALVSQLRSLWDRRDCWETDGDMWILGETAFDVLRECGLDVQPLPDGAARIDVSYTLDTMPNGVTSAELFALAVQGRF